MKTLQNLEAGDLITDGNYYRRILARLGGEGELTTYAVSIRSINLESSNLKSADDVLKTVWDMKYNHYTHYLTPEDKTEKLVEEYAERFYTGSEEADELLRDFAKDLLSKPD